MRLLQACAMTTTALENDRYPPHPPLVGLLILGGEHPNGQMRSHAALTCYLQCHAQAKPVPRLIVSGGAHVTRTGHAVISEAQHMANYLLAAGVPAAHIWQENQALDTLGNIVLGADIALKHGIASRNIVLVSDNFHLPRSHWLFAHVFGHPPQGTLPSGALGSRLLRWREPLALAVQRLSLKHAGITAADIAAHRHYVLRKIERQSIS